MYRRLSDYYADRKYLPSMAYFCLTVLEGKFTNAKRRSAAKSFRIDLAVLDAVGELSSTKGGADAARKAERRTGTNALTQGRAVPRSGCEGNHPPGRRGSPKPRRCLPADHARGSSRPFLTGAEGSSRLGYFHQIPRVSARRPQRRTSARLRSTRRSLSHSPRRQTSSRRSERFQG